MNAAAENPFGINSKNYPEFMGRCSEHIVRKGKDMADYFTESPEPDKIIYEVYEAESQANMRTALTVLKPGKVGTEYHMTKGHFHEDPEAGEVYFCLKGRGIILMQTRDGRTDEVWLEPGSVACIPPLWAHRTVNVGNYDFVMLAIFPTDSGHDYGTIEKEGFIKRVVEENGVPKVV
ncbi:MAG: glucose-6-phosphate isomerase [Candidatus Thermoplasmatota archaeon]|nr:glucose-6-phosphate isomerase [Candidatus Thermoplasmatota archaeon]MBU4070781.1 glucose-6-phosphate isomerase [Candidatus Thermoplasmatota archaeon]MBU4145044.1 glucose-6-phosphate isomerase [Candidatus Thermoplasmatota archaeon]MBU4590963.1 glucose-6-phosphate isomerase [Candidatus Thermoplasmatota archaeon]